MVQNVELISDPERKTGLNAETYKVGIANAIIGMIAYIFLIVPILTLTIVGVLNLSDGHGMAVAVAFVITGLYVTEKYACLNI